MNSKELARKYWFLTRPGDAEEGRFYMPGQNPYQQRGLEVEDGWLPLLDELFSRIAEVVRRDKLTTFEVRQVKEKFGGLRVYVAGANDEIYKLIRDAEDKSIETCERCGRPGKLIRTGWMTTQCPVCDRERRLRLGEMDDDEDERGQRIGEDDEGEQ